MSPSSCGRRTVPRSIAIVPAWTSSPRFLTLAPLEIEPTFRRSPCRSTTSCGYTVSAPRGIGAPVMMRTVWPDATVPANTVPAASSAITASSRVFAAGTSSLATA